MIESKKGKSDKKKLAGLDGRTCNTRPIAAIAAQKNTLKYRSNPR